MKTTLFTTLTWLLSVCLMSLYAQDICPTTVTMKEGSCLMIEYPSAEAAQNAVNAPAEVLVITESSHEESNGTYIAQYNCIGNEVIFTKSGPCDCNDYDGSIAGTFNFTQSDMICIFDAIGALPVEFSFFKAKKDRDVAVLEWGTEFELDNEGFYVEKSSDGKFFQEFSFIVGEGNSTSENKYEAVDRDPFPGVNYYRLKQVDYNGSERFSDITQIDFRENSGTTVRFNSSKDELTITSEKELQSIEIFDMAGVRVYKGALDQNQKQQKISMSDQQRGHFVAVITDDRGSVETTKFSKL